MRQCTFTYLMSLLLLVSCSKSSSFHEINEGGLQVQLMQLESKEQNSAGDFRLRVYTDKKLSESLDKDIQTSMWYKMDSAIYMLNGVNKIYPVAVEPVANGVKNSFEYMIFFEEINKAEELSLIYQDKHLNQRTYTFKLN